MPKDEYKIIIKADKIQNNIHKGRLNIPTMNETAILLCGNEFEKRDIVIQKENNVLQRVYETHRSYDALQYPLIFWQGRKR